MTIQQILKGTIEEQKGLFTFDAKDNDRDVLLRFSIWSRFFFPQFFKVADAPFHKKMDEGYLKIYRGRIKSFVNLAFRNSSKTTRAKLFFAFVIANDREHSRKYLKVLSHDITNCRQFVTDVYNLLIEKRIREMYPEIFEKTETKREETMASFTTATGIKLIADTVGSSQRGSIQDESRPDVCLFDDFEVRETLRSAVKTKTIWDNIQEAKDGLAYDGGCIYLGNYISELGNIHRLVEKKDTGHEVIIIPIVENGVTGDIIAWPARYSEADIEFIKKDSDDWAGEYLCRPDASKDVYFSREQLEKMPTPAPIREISGFKIFREYNPSHRYAGGADVAGGVGLDSSASVFIDFDIVPAQVVGTFHSNTIQPEAFGDELYSEANRFGGCILAIENNRYDQTVLKAKLLGANLYKTGGKEVRVGFHPPTFYGWQTNALTKSKMLSALRQAVEDGLIELNDPDLIKEAKSYSRNDLIDNEPDPRLSTRHHDNLISCAIAFQMMNHTRPKKQEVWSEPPKKRINQAR